MAIESDVLVIGGGLAGATAALSAERAGADVRLVSHKKSTLRQASGLIDALGYVPPGSAGPGEDVVEGPLADPYAGLDALADDHPYSLVGADALRDGLALFDDATGDRYRGSHTDRNALVPTFGGAVKPTARYPASVAAGLASDGRRTLIVGFRSLTAYDARLVADRLRAAGVPFAVTGAEVEFPSAFRPDAVLTRVARALDRDESVDGTPARAALAAAVEPHVDAAEGRVERVGFPAFLGEDRAAEVRADLADRLGADVFEIPMGPPSLPGLRLEDELFDALEAAGVGVETGNPVVGTATTDEGRVESALVEHASRTVPYSADEFVLATGGFVGKGIESDREAVTEPVLGCHVPHPEDRYDWFVDEEFGDQPYARMGVRVTSDLRPLDADGDVQFDNVRAAGGVLGGADVAREKSASGVSLATGVTAGRRAVTGAGR